MMLKLGFSEFWVSWIMRVTDMNCVAIKRVLEKYAAASGQVVNFSKSALCVSSAVERSECERLAAIMGMQVVECNEKYLGLPCITKSVCVRDFGGAQIKIQGKCTGVRGIAYAIRRGSSIRIYEDRWIPRPMAFSIISPPVLDRNAKVDTLMTPSGVWDVDLLRQNFCKEDSDDILRIPISASQVDDVLI
ncbi:hypothetical protein Dsin_001551 [Dipteronia sinensis]|uniref:Uncharacterized protein n=1 Tax=Dipteronia sinensis TaxID=43782 RepID=A0AAE0B5I7_9ROSI|nr:hypothetical protein Dsin_001551 [Dipteronia sinensis]